MNEKRLSKEQIELIKNRAREGYKATDCPPNCTCEDHAYCNTADNDVALLLDVIDALKRRNDFLSTSLDAHAAELDRQSHRARFYSDLTSGVLSYLSGMCNKLSPALRQKVWDYIDRLNLEESKFNEDYIGFRFTKPAPPTPLQFFAGIDTSGLYGE